MYSIEGVTNLQHLLFAAGCTCFLVVLGLAIGQKLTQLGRFPSRTGLERFLIAQALGLGTIAYSMFGLGLIGGIRRIPVIAIFCVMLPVAFSFRIYTICTHGKNYFLHSEFLSRIKRQTLLTKIVMVVLLLFMLINILNALVPPAGRDALLYHLRMPKYFVATGYAAPQQMNYYSYFPALTEMLYTLGVLLSNDYCAHLIHLWFGVLAALAIFSFVRSLSGTQTAFLSTLTFYSLPVVSNISALAYIDLALCFFTILAMGFFFTALKNGDLRLGVLSAILLGFSVAVKYLGLFSVIISFIILLIHLLRSPSSERQPLFRYGICLFLISALVASPWYIRNCIVAGNPVYPFFFSVFGGLGWDGTKQYMLDAFQGSYGMGQSLGDLLLLPWRLVVHGGQGFPFDGRIGPIYLVLVPLLMWQRPKKILAVYMLIYSLCFVWIWSSVSQQIRYLLPSLAALSIGVVSALEVQRPGRGNSIRYAISAAVIGIALFNFSFSVRTFTKYQPLSFVCGRIDRDAFITKHLKNYPPIQYINNTLPSDSKTYMLFIGHVAYYCKKPYVQEIVFEDYGFSKGIMESDSPAQIAAWLTGRGVTHLLINERIAHQSFSSYFNNAQLVRYYQFRNHNLKSIYRHRDMVLYRICGGRMQ